MRVALGLAWVMGAAAPALGDVPPEDAAKAVSLFEEGRAILDAAPQEPARIDAACDKFDESLRLDPQIGTRLNLADCRERQGRLLDAYALFEAAAAEAAQTGKKGRQTFAEQRVAALAARLVRVTLHVASPEAPALRIRLGARELATSDWTQVHLLAPGPIVVTLDAPGRRSKQIERDGVAGSELVIDIPPLDPVVLASTDTPTTWVPYAVAGGGGVLVLSSIALGLHAKSRYDTAAADKDRPAVSSAQHEADAATVVALVGAGAIGVGIWLYVRSRGDHDRIVATPTVTATTVGLSLGSAW